MKFRIKTEGLTGESLVFATQLNTAFEAIPEGLSKEDISAEIKKSFTGFFNEKGEQVFDTKAFQDTMTETVKQLKELSEDFDAYKKAAGKLRNKHFGDYKSFGEVWMDELDNNMKNIEKGQPFAMTLKKVDAMTMKAAAADMTNTTFGGGSSIAIPTIRPDAIIKPGQAVKFRDLVDVVPSATGLYWQHAENGSNGGFGVQVEGQAKNQIDYNFQREVSNCDYIQGYARPSKQLLQDVPYLQMTLPQLLLRDFFIKESQVFYASLTAAIGSSTSTATVNYDQVIDAIAAQEELNFNVTGVVARPSAFAKMLKTKGSGSGEYTYPPGVVIPETGQITFQGIPPFKANWVDPAKAIIGDWDYAHIVQAEDISIRFFEQDVDNVTKNKITVLCEAREGLAIDLTSAFSLTQFAYANA